jgi:hypothetical protein
MDVIVSGKFKGRRQARSSRCRFRTFWLLRTPSGFAPRGRDGCAHSTPAAVWCLGPQCSSQFVDFIPLHL